MKDSLDVIFALAEGHGLPPKIVAELLAATRRYIEDEKQRARVEEIERDRHLVNNVAGMVQQLNQFFK